MLLEREDLVEGLAARLEDAGNGNGSMILVAGEAGAGKTSLVRAFLDSLDDSVLVIEGACDPLTTPRPLSPLYDFAADPDAGLDDLDFDGTPFDTFEGVLDRLRNTIRPIVMVIEDIHWADEGTMDFLRFVGRRVADAKAMVICTYRDDEVGPGHPLRPVLGQVIPLFTTHRLKVPPLTIDAISTLAAGHDVDPRTLLDLTEGNAFYVTEVLAAGHIAPESVEEAVLARVARLEDSSRRVVEAVSIAPRALDVEHATALVGGTAGHVDAALAAGVLVGDGRMLRFRHELARSSVENSLPPARRLSLHMRMLALLDEESDTDLARMAHHAIRAGESDRIVEYAPQAARDASKRGAHREAISFFAAALTQLDQRDERALAAELRLELASEYRIVDQTGKAVLYVEEAVAHYRESGSVGDLGRALIALSRTLWRLNDDRRGMGALSEALELPYDASHSAIEAEAYFFLAHLKMLARRGTEGWEALETARKTAGEDISIDLAWNIDMLEACLHIVLGDARRGVEGLTRSLTAAEELRDPGKTATALSMLGSGGGEARFYPEALAALDRSIEHGLAHDEDYSVAYSRSWLARIAHEQGMWDEAVRQAELVAATAHHKEGIAHVTAMSALGRVRVRRGDPGGLSLLQEVLETRQFQELQHIWNAICGRAEHYWLQGKPGAGLDELAPAYERALDTESEWARGEIGYWMWKSGAIESPPAGAAEPFALQMAGMWREAAAAWREIGCPYEVALSLSEGDEGAQKESLEIFDQLGARPMSSKVRDSLRDMGVDSIPRGPSKATRANPAGLTNRQVEVLRLMTDGMSNAEIADRLFISKKTVEHHVSAIYTKLGVDSRARAISEANKSGIAL